MPAKPKPEFVNGLNRIAALISDRFKIICSKQDIHTWKARTPGFPSPNQANRYDKQECFDWVEKYIIPNRPAVGSGTDRDLLFEKAQEAKALKIIEEARKVKTYNDTEDELLINRELAQQTIRGTIREYHDYAKAEIEKHTPADRREKLLLIGVPAPLVAVFHEWDLIQARLAVDRIEKKCTDKVKAFYDSKKLENK